MALAQRYLRAAACGRWSSLAGATNARPGIRYRSRYSATQARLDDWNNDPYRLFRCRTIMNCTEVLRRGLSPSRAIERTRLRMLNVEDGGGGLALHRVPTIR